jgi:hypothetical protein
MSNEGINEGDSQLIIQIRDIQSVRCDFQGFRPATLGPQKLHGIVHLIRVTD